VLVGEGHNIRLVALLACEGGWGAGGGAQGLS
jgi:hypothetical protein